MGLASNSVKGLCTPQCTLATLMRPGGEQQTLHVTEAGSSEPLGKRHYLPDAVHAHVANAEPAGHTVPQSAGDMGVTPGVQAINSANTRKDILVCQNLS